ncbi:sigma-54-dependent Fis family transcriptional regulator [Candidatus Nitrospira bockiana]
MSAPDALPLRHLDQDAALRRILEGTATETGSRFFHAVVENLAKALGTHGAWVTEYLEHARRLRALAFWMDGAWVQDYEIDIAGTPCEQVITTSRLVHFPDNLLTLYPEDPDIKQTGAVSYLGVPLLDVDGKILGHMAVIDRRPIPDEPRVHALFQIFAARAAAELQRLRAEAEVRLREEKLSRLVASAMDAIIELDGALCVSHVNGAAEQAFRTTADGMRGSSFARFLAPGSVRKLADLMKTLQDGASSEGTGGGPGGRSALWIPGGLEARAADGTPFPAEATLSRFEVHRRTCYTLILRNVDDRLEAERKIRSLSAEAELLKEELQALHRFDEIIGQSETMVRVLRDVAEVAGTDATVLILGETGTGKEVIARAIHAASRRGDKPLVKVNCAAIPATLIESEFFGHEQGAFTGATKKREGRFALADGGTIFLDEIGELPVDLQVKLLRILQEGEFEPVGTSQTRRVDVRVLAATNRDLDQAVRDGRFRQDLYYRLNVFPIQLPPLRDRGDDIGRLAAAFARRVAERMGRTIEPLTEACIRRLRAYSWPGNVRELQNVIERAVITARDGRLNFDRALPEVARPVDPEPPPAASSPTRIRTINELEALERESILAALQACQWRVAGEQGAARLLGINPSTLSSRMKALGIKRPS